ncbi:orotidine-5'-phosphate decarboxylase [Pontibacter sp. G13]|uniref:orotidine-5'-phosphate decarboxylase n=1 Tax=Pontibacter sp. G13 TaxID=3074898 RepID=UPI00288C3B59|nr:orotidine-5'-phosphate decarboxylase [Pontibacter sp. G13]WNJ21312.1 orotidine-5'-phosphate decarboxylase [Pontibacter sp. G13]
MKPEALWSQIQAKKSFLCIGLDTAMDRIPKHLLELEDPIFEFNKQIIEATKDYAVAYKPNLAFYEALGPKGWESLRKTMELIPEEIFTIADAKRGDIGNTSRMYAKTFFETYNFDSVTVAPYMGRDSVAPFLEFEDKWVFLLALTSNPSAADFQYVDDNGQPLYQTVLQKAQGWEQELPGHVGFVVGATKAEKMQEVRKVAPESFLLVPGIGAQGGDLKAVLEFGKTQQGGLLINSSRGIIYAGEGEDFAAKAAEAAKALQVQMAEYV